MYLTRGFMKRNAHLLFLYNLIILVIIFGVFTYKRIANDMRTNDALELSITADYIVDSVDNWFLERTTAVLSTKHLLETIDEDMLLSEESNNPFLNQDSIYEQMQVFLGLDDGRFFTGIDWNPGNKYDPRNRIWYEMAFESERVVFTPHYIDAYSYDLVVTAATAVNLLNGQNGVVAIDFRLSRLNQLIEEIAGLDYQVIIMDQEGGIIASSHLQNVGESFDALYGGVTVMDLSNAHGVEYQGDWQVISHKLAKTDWSLILLNDSRKLVKRSSRIAVIIFSSCAFIILIIGLVLVRVSKDYGAMNEKIHALSFERDRYMALYENRESTNQKHQLNFGVLNVQLSYILDGIMTRLEIIKEYNDARPVHDLIYTVDQMITRYEDVDDLDGLESAIIEEKVISLESIIVWIKSTLVLYAEKMGAEYHFSSSKNYPSEVLFDGLKTQAIFGWLMEVLEYSAVEEINAEFLYTGGRLKLSLKVDQPIIMKENVRSNMARILVKQIGGKLQCDEKTITVSVPAIIYDMQGSDAKDSMFDNLLDNSVTYGNMSGKVAVLSQSKYINHIFKMVGRQLGIEIDHLTNLDRELAMYEMIFFSYSEFEEVSFEFDTGQMLIAMIDDVSVEIMTRLSELNCNGYIIKPASKDKIIEKMKLFFYEKGDSQQ